MFKDYYVCHMALNYLFHGDFKEGTIKFCGVKCKVKPLFRGNTHGVIKYCPRCSKPIVIGDPYGLEYFPAFIPNIQKEDIIGRQLAIWLPTKLYNEFLAQLD